MFHAPGKPHFVRCAIGLVDRFVSPFAFGFLWLLPVVPSVEGGVLSLLLVTGGALVAATVCNVALLPKTVHEVAVVGIGIV